MFIPIRLLWFLLALAVLLPVGVFLLLRSSTPEPIQIQLPAPAATPAEVRVYISGAVQAPDVYQLAQGARVEDALRAAGGAMAEADLERLNLAAILKDADHVYVRRKGEAAAAAPGTSVPGTVGKPLTDINTASQKELEALPGIGEVRATRIIESRERDGRFRAPVDLLERRIITAGVYEQLKDIVTAQ